MVYLHDSYNLHTIFKPGFPGMLECFHAQEELTKVLMPDVAEIFVRVIVLLTISWPSDANIYIGCRTKATYPSLPLPLNGTLPSS